MDDSYSIIQSIDHFEFLLSGIQGKLTWINLNDIKNKVQDKPN